MRHTGSSASSMKPADASGAEIHGVPVLGRIEEAENIVTKQLASKPRRLVMTRDKLDGSDVRMLLELADRHGMTLARLPRLTELKEGVGDRLTTPPHRG